MGLEKINEMRKERGLSLDELSKKSGIPKGTLSKITAGITKNPSVETIKAIVYSMGYTLDDLDENLENNGTIILLDEEKKHIEKYRALDDRGKENVDNVLNLEYNRAISGNNEEDEKAKIRAAFEELMNGDNNNQFSIAAFGGDGVEIKTLTPEEKRAADKAFKELMDDF